MISSFLRPCYVQAVRTRLSLSPIIRHYATRKPAPAGSSSVPRSTPAPAGGYYKPRPTHANLNDTRKLRQIEMAEQLYNSGTRLLYKAGGRLRMFRIQCYTLGAVCFGGIYWNMLAKTVDMDELQRRGIPKFVGITYIVVGVFLSSAGAYSINRVHGQIQTVKLIKKMDRVFLEVTATRRIPFLKRRVVVRPYDMLIDSRLVAWRKVPAWMLSGKLNESSPSAVTTSVIQNTLKAISRSCFYIFASARQFFQQAGILSIDLVQSDAKPKVITGLSLDMGGEYLNHSGTSEKAILWDLATVKQPATPTYR
ncbi:hypothetical protein PMZ80_002294 [Knufia obscura]|uniref:Uncharacterized protein n=2 Tax=Knufia TaxID=430999 RepID=A0AAN8EH25_9EURO|nr:hypothetical protein PMZ80_002294 [Knufia obscura]KAK5950652.1 hypothetical protein OHC33_008319 [Knufia fluminis]